MVSANFHFFSSSIKHRVPPAAVLRATALNEAILFVVVLPDALSSTL